MKYDTLIIKSLSAQTFIGAHEWEKKTPQTISLDLEIDIDANVSAQTDRLEDCLDYVPLVRELRETLRSKHTHLIETLAIWIAQFVLEHPRAHGVKVSLRKPGVIEGAEYGSVVLYRTK